MELEFFILTKKTIIKANFSKDLCMEKEHFTQQIMRKHKVYGKTEF